MAKIIKPKRDHKLMNLPKPDFTTIVPVALDATIGDANDLLNAAQALAKKEGCVWFRAKFLGAGLGFRLEGWHVKPKGGYDVEVVR